MHIQSANAEIQLTQTNNAITSSGHRHQIWSVKTPLAVGACSATGLYTTAFTIYYVGSDPNPIPSNKTASVALNVGSGDFCGVVQPSLSVELASYRVNASDYYAADAPPKATTFAPGSVLYLAAQVRGISATITSVAITKLELSSEHSTSSIQLPFTAYGGESPYPAYQAIAMLPLDRSVFVVRTNSASLSRNLRSADPIGRHSSAIYLLR